MTLHTRRLIIAAPIAELLAVIGILIAGVAVFASLDATATMRMAEMQRIAQWTAPAAGFAFCLLGGWWVARRAAANHERNGLALGVAVAAIDLVLLIASGAPFGAIMATSVIARVAGGFCGGALARRRYTARNRN